MPRVICSLCIEAIEVEGGNASSTAWQEPPGVADVEAERRVWALGVMALEEGFSAKELKKRYRELSKKYHPDVNPNDGAAEAAFKQVQMANEALK